MTNADRIRNMTDKELAEWLYSIVKHCIEEECYNDCPLSDCCSAKTDWEGWMTQEVMDDH